VSSARKTDSGPSVVEVVVVGLAVVVVGALVVEVVVGSVVVAVPNAQPPMNSATIATVANRRSFITASTFG